jgi:hypothetical protein
VLKKRERILKTVKTKYWSVTHKYGLELPKNVAQALAIDRRTRTDFWKLAIEKEIRNVFLAFEFPSRTMKLRYRMTSRWI